jgi:hypothetical protein
MKEESLKWTGFIVSGIILFLSPIIGTLIFVGFLVTADWITGVLKSIKNKDFQSNIAIRKLWVSTGYLFAILTARAVEMYYNDAIPAVMPTVGIIALAEIQSLRENILALTNIDIFKFIIKAFDKNKN